MASSRSTNHSPIERRSEYGDHRRWSALVVGVGSSFVDAAEARRADDDVGLTSARCSPPTMVSHFDRFTRRSLDLVVACVALVIIAVPAMILAIIVKVSSPGPILFAQMRVGRDGRPFTLLKFRTMVDGAHYHLRSDAELFEAYRDNDYKLPGDDLRITKIGRFLRKSSLDELPQLVNVFWGDMSIVGIRPLLAEELAGRPEGDRRLYGVLRPGLTGLWQVEGRSAVGSTDRLALDRRYVVEWSFWNDLKILLRTPMAMLRVSRAR